MKLLADLLNERIIACKAPVVIGLDPVISKIPQAYLTEYDDTIAGATNAIFDFNCDIIDTVCDIVPAVKPQIAFYELFGSQGILLFEKTVRYAKSKGLLVIEDGKRNDIGNTAMAYARGHLGTVQLANREVENAYGVDFLTVSPFLGAESLEPFIQICNSENKGIFILVRTSNAGNGLIQDAIDANGDSVSEALAHYIHAQASASIGESGYSLIGAVVGATYPAQAARLRAIMDTSLFLVPGFGAQGGSAADILPCFHANGLGAIVNSSRGVLYAHLAHHGNACSKGAYKQSVLTAANAMCGAIYESLHSHFPLLCY